MSISRPKDYSTVIKSLIRDATSQNVQYNKLKRWHDDDEAEDIKTARDLIIKVLKDKFKIDMSFLTTMKFSERIKHIDKIISPPSADQQNASSTINSSEALPPVVAKSKNITIMINRYREYLDRPKLWPKYKALLNQINWFERGEIYATLHQELGHPPWHEYEHNGEMYFEEYDKIDEEPPTIDINTLPIIEGNEEEEQNEDE